MAEHKISTPLTDDVLNKLEAGDTLFITGEIYTARDQAHKKLIDALDAGEKLPFDPKGQIVYYVGPSPAKPGKVIGSAGPTTSGRMDPYTPRLLDEGIRGMIGKGLRSKDVVESMKKNGAIYMAAVGGAAALISRSITAAEVIAFDDLGPEAVRRLEVKDFPVIVVIDKNGKNLYEEGRAEYKDRLNEAN
ncbi:MAG: Fe-S-containing hydro-lyase [Acidobacteria bacterium]|nr:Fe-S-containing hydro-lyase [Acidobacteriota bacterium]